MIQESSIKKKEFASRIFIVEDTPNIREYLEVLLQAMGFQVVSSASGKEALEKIQERLPDLILLDILLTDIDGLSICQKLKANPRTQKIPIIMISCLSDHNTLKSAAAYGAVDFIEKPFQELVLKDKIQKALSLRYD